MTPDLLRPSDTCGFHGGPEGVSDEEVELAREELYRRRPELAPQQD